MRFLLFTAAFLPMIVFAEGTCYSPSDCAAPQICSSFMDGVFPGVCMEAAEGDVPLYEFEEAMPMDSSSSSTSSSVSSHVSSSSSTSSASIPAPKPPLAEVRVLSSASSSVPSSESSSSFSSAASEPESVETFFAKALGDIVSGVKNVFCFFFCE